jgi:ubiquinone/menaquinone biosynthesis C-methylase UbiE
MANESVREFYDRFGRMEWERTDSSAYNKVERSITLHYLDKYLPSRGVVLDAGSGPGRYSIELAKRGFDVILLDISRVQLKIAKEEVSKLPPDVRRHIKGYIQGTIENLSMFPDGMFDAVVCLGGTISHLVECDAREDAAEELARVAKDGGPVFVSVLSFYGALRKVLTEYPEDMDVVPTFLDSHLNPGGAAFTDCFFFTPEEMVDLLARKGIEVVEYVGVQGLSAHLKDVTEDCYQRRDRWKIWQDVLIRTCNHPSVVGVSDHILCIGFA